MNKRLWKKRIKTMSDKELNEHVAYCENKRFRTLFEKEFDQRYEVEANAKDGYELENIFK